MKTEIIPLLSPPAAYGQAAGTVLRWRRDEGITRIADVQPVHVAGPMRCASRHSVIKGATTHFKRQPPSRNASTCRICYGLRDRAIIPAMVYVFARASAVVRLKVEDYFP